MALMINHKPCFHALDKMIALVLVVLVTIIFMLFSVHVRADEAAPSAPSCQPISLIQQRLRLVLPQFVHFRRVDPRHMNDVNELFDLLATDKTGGPWDSAILIDGSLDDGILMVGHGDEMCRMIYFKAPEWAKLVRILEGLPA